MNPEKFPLNRFCIFSWLFETENVLPVTMTPARDAFEITVLPKLDAVIAAG